MSSGIHAAEVDLTPNLSMVQLIYYVKAIFENLKKKDEKNCQNLLIFKNFFVRLHA